MPGSQRPNVLLVVLDAARRDTFSPYNASARTPALAGLARRGVAVRQAFATASWTLPSHTAMFTGSLAHEFGLDQAPGDDQRGVRGRVRALGDRLLASHLAGAGYATHGYSANLWISPHSGFDAGFDSFAYTPSRRLERAVDPASTRRGATLAWAREGLAASGDDGAAAIGRDLRQAISSADPSQPQFWFANLVEAHSPYLPPRPWNDLAAPQRIRAALDCQRYLNFEAICVAAAGGSSAPPSALARLAYLHRQSVAFMDAWLAGVLAALAARSMLENTLVIVCSDHGECFGEAGLLAHGFSLIAPLIHVPLVAAGPGAERFAASTGALSLRELPGLIAMATGGDPEPFGPPGDGVAVARATPICPADDPRMVAFADRWSLSPAQVERLTVGYWSATDGERTVTLTNGAPDLTGGPPEPHLLAALEQAASTPALAAYGPPGSSLGSAELSELAPGDEDAVAALERQMKLLGYM